MDYIHALLSFTVCGLSLQSIEAASAALCLAAMVAVCCAIRRFYGVAAAVASLAACDALRAVLAPLYQGQGKPYEGAAFVLWLAFGILPVMVPLVVFLWAGTGVRAPWLPFALTLAVAAAYPALRGPALLDVIFVMYASTYILIAAMSVVRAFAARGMTQPEIMMITLCFTGIASIAIVRCFGPPGWGGVPITYSAGLVVVGAQALGGDPGSPPRGDQSRGEASPA